ncbi:MAG: hypothetical protein QOK10_2181 [Pseudonocardiales bacterium]|jgi:uncharacterized membrane protein HdeD (DUF308 family)|nr:hypothetical protein [Pseudonocardiales bacterium]
MKAATFGLAGKGIISIVIGLVVVGWPNVTVHIFVIVFALYAITSAAAGAVRLIASRSALAILGRLLLVLLDTIACIAALKWPAVTTHVAVVIVAAWALVTGILELGFAVGSRDLASRLSLLALEALMPIALGLVCAIRPDVTAATIAHSFGLFCLIAGAGALAEAYDARHYDDVPASVIHAAVP